MNQPQAEHLNINELKRCAHYNGINTATVPHANLDATLSIKGKADGNVIVTVHSNHFANSGPSVSLADHIARGFGLAHSEFKPRYTSFKFDSKDNALTVWDKKCQFRLMFQSR
ncbi:hypothetical protein B4P00_21955 [Shewanella xiamenensis]|jgi:hypothetical protein|uniref:hypothetical protein n=1 Tax=Shewanella xiamenensis TaxID=332186 RepID=UPI000849B4B1|nr:hypothetical protein [Shewanella xiamenensis]MBW0298834.1 hypothetical protein [Shewanella xiamenensis]ODR83775.1 hypothetical protein ABT47_23750 [Shewanella xiamenensis]